MIRLRWLHAAAFSAVLLLLLCTKAIQIYAQPTSSSLTVQAEEVKSNKPMDTAAESGREIISATKRLRTY